MPRDLSLYSSEGETYVKVTPSPELLKLRDKGSKKRAFKVDRTYNLDKLLNDNSGTYEIEMTIKNKDADVIGFQLFNSKGEEVEMYYNLAEKTFTMDRIKSGEVSFSKFVPCKEYFLIFIKPDVSCIYVHVSTGAIAGFPDQYVYDRYPCFLPCTGTE